jgi:hypothetical protein
MDPLITAVSGWSLSCCRQWGCIGVGMKRRRRRVKSKRLGYSGATSSGEALRGVSIATDNTIH